MTGSKSSVRGEVLERFPRQNFLGVLTSEHCRLFLCRFSSELLPFSSPIAGVSTGEENRASPPHRLCSGRGGLWLAEQCQREAGRLLTQPTLGCTLRHQQPLAAPFTTVLGTHRHLGSLGSACGQH